MTSLALGTSRPINAAPDRFSGYVEQGADGLSQLNLMVVGAHCGACVRRIEDALAATDGVERARLNLSTRRLEILWRGPAGRADSFVAAIDGLGYEASPYLPELLPQRDAALQGHLLRALAVSFFALSNVMMLSWGVWAGHSGGMGEGTRAFFHWLSALIALPAIAYAGRHFYASAWAVLRRGRTNMDVPISLGVLLTTGMSLVETLRGGPHIYFDGALSLLFVLLAGRYLDQRARASARSAVERLSRLASRPVQVVGPDGMLVARPPNEVRPGERVLVAAGETIGVDGSVIEGRSSVDRSQIDGETIPHPVAPGDVVHAGSLNLGQPLVVRTQAAGSTTFLANILRLLEAAEQKKGRYVSFADRMVRWYTPVVHALAAATFLGWLLLADAAWQIALVHAVSVLIIACPCALGLAVPVTQVVAAGRLMRRGVLIKSETALERLAEIDTILFDKTGTLTQGRPALLSESWPDDALEMASGMAASSRHPLALALREAAPNAPALAGVTEAPGQGLAWSSPRGEARLGSAAWCGLPSAEQEDQPLATWLARPGLPVVRFSFADPLRTGAEAALSSLKRAGYRLGILSGDRDEPVSRLAARLEIDARSGLTPADKLSGIATLTAKGRRVLMVGDGLNDAPSLAGAHASLAPASAIDVSLRAADAIWQGRSLGVLPELLAVARKARAIVLQNIGFSFVYNAAWVPVAMAGLVTPWIAALAMSASSILVTLNALRLGRDNRESQRWTS